MRPSFRELDKKLATAKRCLEEGCASFANPSKAVGELYALGVGDSAAVWALIELLLEEIEPSHYRGTFPPQRSYEKTIEGKELFAFRWFSPRMKREMYLKFALKGEHYYYVSLHENKVRKENAAVFAMQQSRV